MEASAVQREPAGAQVDRDPERTGTSVVTVRYWAAARAAAGTAEERLTGSTLAEVLAAARSARPGSDRFAQVLAVCSFLVGDVPVGRRDPFEVPLESGDVVEVLPPFAGG